MRLKRGILKSFNSGSYTAVFQIAGSYKVYMEDIAVARNIPSGEMVAGRKLAGLSSLTSTIPKRRW